jgi:hypothetical protein
VDALLAVLFEVFFFCFALFADVFAGLLDAGLDVALAGLF